MSNQFKLFPFNFARVEYASSISLVSNDGGEFLFISNDRLDSLINGEINNSIDREKLTTRSFIYSKQDYEVQSRILASKIKTRKSFIQKGPGLHIFVVTLRCLNSCDYCQVSRKKVTSQGYDMSLEHAKKSVDLMFQSPSESYTVEFQGGEPTLALNVIRYIISYTKEVNVSYNKKITFVVATTLSHIDLDTLLYFKDENVNISTSLDGPEWLHNKNRPQFGFNSYEQTIKGIDLARRVLGNDRVSAMATLTKLSLSHPKEIVDEYVSRDFKSIFLRPLNNYGHAVIKHKKIGYNPGSYNKFYNEAMNYIIQRNKNGIRLDEVNATLALNNILTPYSHGYVDLRSPCGDGIGVLVYNYDGYVYPSDEARMLKEMGDDSLCLGSVSQSYHELMHSPPIEWILNMGIAESLPGCSDCVYLPYCGADPISAMSSQHDPIGYRHSNGFCLYQKTIFDYVFKEIYKNNEDTIRVFYSWMNHCDMNEIPESGYRGWLC